MIDQILLAVADQSGVWPYIVGGALLLAPLGKRRRPRLDGLFSGTRAPGEAARHGAAEGTHDLRREPTPSYADGCVISVRPVLNGEERALAARLDELLALAPGRYRLLAQVSLDEIFTVTGGRDRKARFGVRGTFSQKRVDFLVVDPAARPVLGIEYQGSGHHKGNAAERDAAKARTFARAGLPLHCIDHGYHWRTEARTLQGLLGIGQNAAA